MRVEGRSSGRGSYDVRRIGVAVEPEAVWSRRRILRTLEVLDAIFVILILGLDRIPAKDRGTVEPREVVRLALTRGHVRDECEHVLRLLI